MFVTEATIPVRFESEAADALYEVCVAFPTGEELCAGEQEAQAGALYVNTISTADIPGIYNVTWSVGGQQVGSWPFRLAPHAIKLTSAAAGAAFKAEITKESPNAVFPRREGKFCPEIYSGSDGDYSICYAEYKIGKIWHLLGASATAKNGEIAFSFGTHANWRRKWVRCSLRGAHAPGRLVSNNGCGRHQPESDAYFIGDEVYPLVRLHRAVRAIGWQFTESAGFTSLGIYHVSKRGGTYTFTNAVGDSFRYKP